jgi:hypothetical protein
MDISNVLKTVSPWIASALGGPLAGVAIDALANVLGLQDKTVESVKNALSSATPEQLLAVKQADQDFQVKMQALGYANIKDMQALEDADRDSARNREIQVKDNTPKTLAYIIVGAFVIISGGVVFGTPSVDSALAGTIIGYLAAKADQPFSYYFGSTKGSSEKTQIMASAIKNKV